ncbi:MAG: sulfotransferase [Candidatus Lokiarchaeota archaeon]|nr:sulfotransferase [Candidatus Lokiarchaeota archaeon]
MIRIKSSESGSFKLPVLGYAAYGVNKFFDKFKSISLFLDKLETLALHNDIDKINIEKPIYITGLARAGTTIILEMLSKHLDVATHQYKHILMPYLPYWFSLIANRIKIYTKPFERFHKDGIIVSRESPEALEEIFWRKFFDNYHDENISKVLSGDVSNSKFEKFYRNHIRKLIFNQNRSRYLAKNNYHVTRLEYLLRIFPDSKFLIIIRNPINHIASLIKQTMLILRMEIEHPLLTDWLRISGHNEFGYRQLCINIGNAELIHEIRELWDFKETYVKGWALYWNSIYNFVANQLDTNKKLKKATLIVRYDELCETPEKIIEEILEHLELQTKIFKTNKKYYIYHLHKPTYYTPNFTQKDIENISEITKATAARFGLH